MNDANHMRQLADALGQWHDFYMLLGGASATLVGLLFVAASVGAGAFSGVRRGASRMFLSASVIHFSSLLIACLIVLAPAENWVSLGVMIAMSGTFGLVYYGLTWRDTVRDGLSKRIDWDDRIWYGVLPVICYMCETASGVALALRSAFGCMALALSLVLLLMIGIHNAWDITLWSITRRRE
jgi:hypothetical protein